MSNPMGLRRVDLLITEEQYQFLRKQAFDENTSMSELVRRAIDELIKKAQEERKEKQTK